MVCHYSILRYGCPKIFYFRHCCYRQDDEESDTLFLLALSKSVQQDPCETDSLLIKDHNLC